MEEHQVIIVGGGPSGAGCGKRLAELGIDTLILEKCERIGEPVQCAGLISPRTYEMAGTSAPILNKIHGGTIYSPGGRTIHLHSTNAKAFVIDRVEFDRGIMEEALDAGVKLYREARVVGIWEDRDGFKVRIATGREEIECKCSYLIGADGSGSFVRRKLGFPEPREMLFGYGTHGTGAEIPDEECVIIIGDDIAPGFFAWIIPEGSEGGARVGLCVPSKIGSPAAYYKKLVEHPLGKRYLERYEARKSISGKIALGLIEPCTKGRCALLGDSAAMAKPVSGGGIYPALTAAEALARCIHENIEAGEHFDEPLDKYQKFIEKEIRPEIHVAMAGREIYKKIPPEQVDRAFDLLNTGRVLKYIMEKGDIDHPFDIAPGLLFRAPKLASLGMSLLPSFF